MICECCQAATTSDEACYLMASIVCGECFLADNGGGDRVTRPGSRISASDIDYLTDEVETVLVSGWRDESREAWHIAADIVAVILDKCLTVCNNDTNGATSSTNERGN
jgi:hypothetical protein